MLGMNVLGLESIYNVPKVVSDMSGIALDEAICKNVLFC